MHTMPLLDRTGPIPELWQRADGIAPGRIDHALLDLAALEAALVAVRPGQKLGVIIANTVAADTLTKWFDLLSLIAITFPAYGDGRGFSLAKRLRRLGYTGRLRAVGPLIADQFAYALACGFDEIELPEAHADRQPAAQWTNALAAISSTYQRGYSGQQGSILDRRRLARTDGHA
jgi:uncharacterized protein (DUF934 family)